MPETLVGLVVFAAGAGPGYVFIRIAERWTPRQERSALLEAAELVVVGATATAIAVLFVLAIATCTGWIDGNQLIADRFTYAIKEPARSLGALIVVLVISYGGAALIAYLLYTPHGVPKEDRKLIRPNDTVWYGVFSRDLPARHAVWITVEMKDGRLVSGLLRAFPTGDEDRRELALAPPKGGHIEMVNSSTGMRSTLTSDALILTESDIRNIHVRYTPLVPRT
jgi:hypothetical protein